MYLSKIDVVTSGTRLVTFDMAGAGVARSEIFQLQPAVDTGGLMVTLVLEKVAPSPIHSNNDRPETIPQVPPLKKKE